MFSSLIRCLPAAIASSVPVVSRDAIFPFLSVRVRSVSGSPMYCLDSSVRLIVGEVPSASSMDAAVLTRRRIRRIPILDVEEGKRY